MRTILPVTGRETELADHAPFVSQTDLGGLITHFNQDFLPSCGHSEAEPIGSPHDIACHPDMCSGAFEDLWRTPKSRRPWTGNVKRGAKTGDHCGIPATPLPAREEGHGFRHRAVRRKGGCTRVDAQQVACVRFRKGMQGCARLRRAALVAGWTRGRELSPAGRIPALLPAPGHAMPHRRTGSMTFVPSAPAAEPDFDGVLVAQIAWQRRPTNLLAGKGDAPGPTSAGRDEFRAIGQRSRERSRHFGRHRT